MAFAGQKAAVVLAFILVAMFSARSGRAGVVVEPHVGFHGVFQLGRPFPLKVKLINTGPAVEGTLEVQFWKGGGSRAGAMYPLSHRRDLFLSAQSRKEFSFTVDPDFLSRPLKISFTSPGGVVAREIDLRHYFSPSPVVLLLSEGDRAARISLGSSTRNRLIALTLAELPADPRALLGVSHLILYDQSLRDLSRYQFLALDRWLIAGGQMIILGSLNYPLYQEPTISRFLPVRVTGMKKIPMLPSLADAQGVTPIADVWVQASRVIRGHVLMQAQGIPILVETSRGKGKITYLAPDVGRPPVSHWDGISALLGGLLGSPTDAAPAAGGAGPRWDDAVFTRVISNPSLISIYVPTVPLFLATLGYLAGIGLFAWHWTRRRKVPLTVVLLAAYIVLAAAGGYLFFDRGGKSPDGILLCSTALDEIADGYVEAQANVALFSTQLRQYELQVRRDWLAWVPMSLVSRKPRERPVILEDGSGNGRFLIPLDEWDHRLFKVRFVERFPFRVQLEQKGDSLVLKVDNQTDHDLVDSYFVAAGRRYALGTIARGSRWAKAFPLPAAASQEGDALRSNAAAALGDVSFQDKTRDILFHSSFFSTPGGAVSSANNAAIFFGWVKDAKPRVWVDHAGIWAYNYTLFRSIMPLDAGEDA